MFYAHVLIAYLYDGFVVIYKLFRILNIVLCVIYGVVIVVVINNCFSLSFKLIKTFTYTYTFLKH